MAPPLEEGPGSAASALTKSQSDVLNHSISYLGMPAFILTTFFPELFGKLSRYPKAIKMITIPLALWLAVNFAASKLTSLWAYLMSWGMASVLISSDDYQLHASFKRFLTTKKMIMIKRNKLATSVFHLHNQGHLGRTYERELAEDNNMVFDPENKLQVFFHNRRLFVITTEVKPVPLTSNIRVWTLGWSTTPLERLLAEAYEARQIKEAKYNITILAPYSGRQWQQRCVRPRRPLETVYLDETQKTNLVDDITEYLSKDTQQWYQDRGIPYRRGYLFHGSPGTGKTSLALSLAGHFKLVVYIVSLLDNEVSDSALMTLLQSIRSGSLLLLEDVDSAGLGRETDSTVEIIDGATKKKSSHTSSSSSDKRYRTSTRVTLSGLLNAIDGAGAPEGHVLIMTSNKPDDLDEALTRPGRIDVKVGFENANKEQIKAIFLNMYEPKIIQTIRAGGGSGGSRDNDTEPVKMTTSTTITMGARQDGEKKEEEEDSSTELLRMADTFASKVPEGKFSPAELQDYILLYKKLPKKALDDVGGWVEKELKERERKARLEAQEVEEVEGKGGVDIEGEGGQKKEGVEKKESEVKEGGVESNGVQSNGETGAEVDGKKEDGETDTSTAAAAEADNKKIEDKKTEEKKKVKDMLDGDGQMVNGTH